MRQLYKPQVTIEVHMKSGEVYKKNVRCQRNYGIVPQDKLETYHVVKEFMDKYSPSYVYWYCTFLKRNMWKKIEINDGKYRVLKICDIDYINYIITYNTKLYSQSLSQLTKELSSDEFLQYLYDKEKEFKASDILESVKER